MSTYFQGWRTPIVLRRLSKISIHLASLRLCSPFLKMVTSLIATQVSKEEKMNDDEDEEHEEEQEENNRVDGNEKTMDLAQQGLICKIF